MSITRKILYTAAGFAAFILAAILYSFIDSRVANKPELDSPEAYGLESLEYEAEPILDLIVWQKNALDIYEYDIPGYSEFYYEKTVLPLRKGETVLSHTDTKIIQSSEGLTFTVEYDGQITGQYDFTKNEVLYYGGNNDKIPGMWWGSDEYMSNSDATFEGDKSVTFHIPQYAPINTAYYNGSSNVKHDKYVEQWLEKRIVRDSFDRENFCVLQKFHEVYPDAPEALEKVERSVTTSLLTINAMHPTKKDIVVATAEIQIKTYSMWQIDGSLEYEDWLFLQDYQETVYSEITVLSYKQSDSFSW